MDITSFSARMIQWMPQLIRGFNRQESNHLSRGQITLPQLWALEYLSFHGNCPMSELANFLGVTRPAATGMVDRLIAQGLIQRQHDKKDRRIIRINIATKGRHIIRTIWEQKRRTLIRVFGKISPADRAQYLQTIEQVVEILSKENQRRSL